MDQAITQKHSLATPSVLTINTFFPQSLLHTLTVLIRRCSSKLCYLFSCPTFFTSLSLSFVNSFVISTFFFFCLFLFFGSNDLNPSLFCLTDSLAPTFLPRCLSPLLYPHYFLLVYFFFFWKQWSQSLYLLLNRFSCYCCLSLCM